MSPALRFPARVPERASCYQRSSPRGGASSAGAIAAWRSFSCERCSPRSRGRGLGYTWRRRDAPGSRCSSLTPADGLIPSVPSLSLYILAPRYPGRFAPESSGHFLGRGIFRLCCPGCHGRPCTSPLWNHYSGSTTLLPSRKKEEGSLRGLDSFSLLFILLNQDLKGPIERSKG